MHGLYSETRTWLHAWPAGVKLALLAVLGTGLFLTGHPWVLLAGALACAALFLSLGPVARQARRLVVPLVLAALLMALFHALVGQPQVGLVSALRLLSAALLGTLLTLTTRPSDLLEVLERLLSPLGRLGVKVDELALQLALMLRFTEHFFALWKRLDEAHRVRVGKPGRVTILAPLVIVAMMSARRVADALQLRLRR